MVSGSAFVVFVSTGTPETAPCLMVYVNGHRLLFNCGEGTQRMCIDHKLRYSSVEGYFFTQSRWTHMGGVPGGLMTCSNGGAVDYVRLHGPKGIAEMWDAAKEFCHGDELSMRVDIEDGLSLEQLALSDNGNNDTLMKGKHLTRYEGGVTVRTLCLTEKVFCYAVHLDDIPGRFDITAADALGVPKVMRKHLSAGQSITLDNGDIITPEQCVGKVSPGGVLLVIDLNSISDAEILTTSDTFNDYIGNGIYASRVDHIVHFASADIILSNPYCSWMEIFPTSTEHLISNYSSCGRPITNVRAASQLATLNAILPHVFPLQFDDPPTTVALPDISSRNISIAQPLKAFGLRRMRSSAGYSGVDSSSILSLESVDVTTLHATALSHPEVVSVVEDLKVMCSTLDEDTIGNSRLPSITFLGTGAALPSAYRNVSSTLITVKHKAGRNAYLLFDVGEGTCEQIARYFGPEGLRDVLMNLSSIWISHMHADHHIGLIAALSLRQQFQASAPSDETDTDRLPITIVGPLALGTWLTKYSSNVEALSFSFIDSGIICKKTCTLEAVEVALGATLTAVPVIHVDPSYGLVLAHKCDLTKAESEWKIVLSGDTRPCQELEIAGHGASLLIHEATFGDELLCEAERRHHTTTNEAMETSALMHANFVFLSHFSQRYLKCPVLSLNLSNATNVGIAFDGMTVRICDLPLLPTIVPALRILFPVTVQDYAVGDIDSS